MKQTQQSSDAQIADMREKKQILRIEGCSYKAAKYAVEHWHYSQRMPSAKLVKYGVWENGIFIGAIIFGRGANRQIMSPFGLEQKDGCELVRIALTNHITPVSRLISVSLSLLLKNSPNLKLVVSYADEAQGHVGKIYQASNWFYLGAQKTTPLWYYKGKWVHNRTISEELKQQLNLPKKDGGLKHKYVYPLDRSLIPMLNQMSKAYPAIVV